MTRKAVLLLICMGWLLQVAAQQEFFIFIQHEKNQPFYVRMGERTFSSSALGHVILSKLKDSTYKFSIGFPNNQFPEQEYNIQLNKKDKGFELKNLPEKGWSLFDLHSLELISPVKVAGSSSTGGGVAFIKRNDDFARLMSGVVNDTAVLYVAAVTEKKPAPVVAKKADTVSAELTKVSKKPDSVVTDAGVTRNDVTPTKTDIPKKTDSVEQTKKPDVVAAEQDKKSETTSTTNPVKKTDPVSPDLTNIKKTDTVSTELANVSKKNESQVKEISKSADSIKKVTAEPVNDSVFNPPAVPVITLVKQYATDSGYHMLMVDDKDSVNIFIPGDAKDVARADKQEVKTGAEKTVAKDPDTKTNIDDKNADKSAAVVEKAQENKDAKQDNKTVTPDGKAVKEENKTVNPDTKSTAPDKPLENKAQDKKLSDQNTSPAKDNLPATKSDAVAQKPADDTTKKPSKLVMINSDCRAFATNNDVDKLRVKLIQEKDAESRIAAAKKIFKTKCFSALQIKALSELFPYDDQKYQFLEAAYPFVSDTAAFKDLVSLLDDPSYVSRFRKLVRLD